MKLLNWLILTGNVLALFFAEVAKDRTKYLTAIDDWKTNGNKGSKPNFKMGLAVPRWIRGVAYGLITGTSMNMIVTTLNAGE